MNRILGNLLRCLVGNKLSNLDSMLAQYELAYNNSVNKSTSKTPFQIFTGIQLRGISILRDIIVEEKRSIGEEALPKYMKSLHEAMKHKLEQSNQK